MKWVNWATIVGKLTNLQGCSRTEVRYPKRWSGWTDKNWYRINNWSTRGYLRKWGVGVWKSGVWSLKLTVVGGEFWVRSLETEEGSAKYGRWKFWSSVSGWACRSRGLSRKFEVRSGEFEVWSWKLRVDSFEFAVSDWACRSRGLKSGVTLSGWACRSH